MNHLYYGDNLTVLRESVGTASVDLIYLDPPFNSNAGYNVLFKAPDGSGSAAQIEAFDDTWLMGNNRCRCPVNCGKMVEPFGNFLGGLTSAMSTGQTLLRGQS
jgi:hypothetical protein